MPEEKRRKLTLNELNALRDKFVVLHTPEGEYGGRFKRDYHGRRLYFVFKGEGLVQMVGPVPPRVIETDGNNFYLTKRLPVYAPDTVGGERQRELLSYLSGSARQTG